MILHPLHAILDADAAVQHGWQPADLAAPFITGGARFIQVRAKQLPSAAFLHLVEAVARQARAAGVTVIVNDRADLARMAGADGVHVGQDDLPVADVRALLGSQAVIGYSVHTPAQLEEALRQPVSYVAVGPVFGTRTKATGYAPVGLELVREAARRCGAVPVVAIGGITLETAPAVREAGATSVAVIADLLATGDPQARIRRYVETLT